MSSSLPSNVLPRPTIFPWPWRMLVSRISLFLGFQAAIAAGYQLAGSSQAWEASAAWWPLSVTITNLICIALLTRLFKQDGRRFWDIFRVQKGGLKSDLRVLLVVMIVLGPVSFLPNILLSSLLFGDAQTAVDFLIRPLPYWAAYAGLILFPITQGLAELPTYFAFVEPKLEERGLRSWTAVGLASLFLGLQHIAIPFWPNSSYLIWRGLMFLPFAVLVGIVLHKRFSLLPYLAAIHVLMDLSFAAMLLGAAY